MSVPAVESVRGRKLLAELVERYPGLSSKRLSDLTVPELWDLLLAADRGRRKKRRKRG